jgi:hypothetical protein
MPLSALYILAFSWVLLSQSAHPSLHSRRRWESTTRLNDGAGAWSQNLATISCGTVAWVPASAEMTKSERGVLDIAGVNVSDSRATLGTPGIRRVPASPSAGARLPGRQGERKADGPEGVNPSIPATPVASQLCTRERKPRRCRPMSWQCQQETLPCCVTGPWSASLRGAIGSHPVPMSVPCS